MRVHALIDSLGVGGAETLLADLAAGAPAAGLELSVAYLYEREAEPAADRLRAHRVEPVRLPVGRLGPAALRTVRRHLAAARPDVLHTHLAYADLLGGPAARSLRLPAVATVHVMQEFPGRRESLRRSLTAFSRRRCLRAVIAVSDAARDWILERDRLPPGHVRTVHNGIDARPEPGAGRAVRAELGVAADDLVVMMLSVLRAGKGHDVAIEAVAELRERFPRLRLVIAGGGPAADDVRRLARGLGDTAVLTGHRADVMALLDASDVLVHPSSVDAFPTALLEAMAAGVPVVATRVGGIPEIVDDGETGFLFEPPARAPAVAAALAPLLADQGLRRATGARARERFAERFTAERWAERLRAVYEEVRGK